MNAIDTEQLRQEKEAFDANRRQSDAWFKLRLRTGYICLLLFVFVAVCCFYVIFCHRLFPIGSAPAAFGVLSVDIVMMVRTMLNMVMKSDSLGRLRPVTQSR